jgi:hypothetical protein
MNKRVYDEEAAGTLVSAALASTSMGKSPVNEATGEILDPATMRQKIAAHQRGAQVAETQLDAVSKNLLRWYRLRDYGLLAGLALLVVARVVGAYTG